MKHNFYASSLRLPWKLLCVLGILLPAIARATYTPVAISSGYNVDVVANGTGAASTKTTAPFDNDPNEWALMTNGYNNGSTVSTAGLPANGTLNSVAIPGLSFQFADFDQNNALQINTTNGTGTLVFGTPTTAGEIYLLGAAGNGPATIEVTVNYASGPPEVISGVTVLDWYDQAGFSIQGLSRVSRTGNNIDVNTINPRLYHIKVSLNSSNWTNPITSIDIKRTSTGGRMNIMAVTVNDACTGTPTGGTTSMVPAIICPNASFTLSTSGSSSNVGLTYHWQSSPAGAGTWSNIANATNPTYTASSGIATATDYRLEITCTASGLSNTSSVLTATPATALPVGTYTINPAVATGGTNFHSFFDAVSALKCGIAGSVVFNVTNAIYNEQISIPAIPGASATKTVTFNGNGATITYLSTSSSTPSTVELNGADRITFNDMNFVATGPTYAYACHLWNQADTNSFNNCTFTVNVNATSSSQVPFSISGSATSVTTSGTSGNGNVLTGCRMNNGYYGCVFYGSSSTAQKGNKLINSRVSDFNTYGCYVVYQNGAVFTSDTVERPVVTNPSTFYGIYLNTGCSNALVERCLLRNPFGSSPNNINNVYAIYVSASATAGNENKIYNNVITNMNGYGGMNGLYMSGGTYVRVYHNTINFDFTGVNTNTIYGIYATGTTAVYIRNNNVSITQPGYGTKSALYYSGSGGKYSNYNNLYVNSQGGTNYIGYYSTSSLGATTLTAWKAVNTNAWDTASVSMDPMFAGAAANNLTPNNGALDNLGTPLGVTSDYLNSARSTTTPDIGAYEFALPACTGAPAAGTVSGPSSSCNNSSFTLMLSGNSVGAGLSIQWESSPAGAGTWTAITGATNASLITTVTASTDFHAVVTCAGGSSSSSNTFTVNLPAPFPAGTYTINSAAATGSGNFHSFNDAISAISCGIAGNVVFNVVAGSGPYNEQVTIPSTVGANAGKTVTINGNGATLTYAGNTVMPHTLGFDGADYFTINDLTIAGTDAASALVCHLWGQSDTNSFNNCRFLAPQTGTATTEIPFCVSSTVLSPTTQGVAGNGNVATGCTMDGGYYGAVFYAASATPAVGNKLLNCHFKDFYAYGAYAGYQNGVVISSDTSERPTRTNLSTFYGIYLTTGCTNALVEKNVIRNPFGGVANSSNSFYGIYVTASASAGNENKVYNNLIANVNATATIYGMYLSSSTFIKAYHNTINLDNTVGNGTSSMYGLYAAGGSGVDIRNNNITITQPGNGSKYVIYLEGGAGKTSNNNNLFINATGGNNYVGAYYNTSTFVVTPYANLAAWQGANSSAWDQASLSIDPIYTSAASFNFLPTNGLLDNKGAALSITTDILGVTRNSATPDIGAYEFSPGLCTGTPVAGTATIAGNITSACVGGPINLTLTGFTVDLGITVQWESSPSGLGNWLPIAGATSSALSTTLAGGATDYRATVTCTNGGGSDFSNTISVATNPFYLCYCSPLTSTQLHSSTSNYVSNVNITGTTLNSNTTAVGSGGYTQADYTVSTNTASLIQGQYYTLNATVTSASYQTEVWIDWNQNGTFDASEYYPLSAATAASVLIYVPVNAVPGLTGLRVRNVASTTTIFGSAGACANISGGRETEDYVVTIVPGVQCSGTPSSAGTATIDKTAICNGMGVRLQLGSFPTDLGITMNWESSPTGLNTFTPISGATFFDYTTQALSSSTDFRMAVTCSNPGGGTAYSNIVSVAVNNPPITSTTPGSRCGVGTVNLSATTNAGSQINWYAAATGGVPLATTANFTTPVLTQTTTFYAAGTNGSQTQNSPMPALGPNVSTSTYAGLVIDVNQDLILNTADVYSLNAGTITVELRNSAGTLLTSSSHTVVAGSYTTPQTLTLNYSIPAGTGYRLLLVSSITIGYQGGTYPLALGNNAGAIVNGAVGASGSTSTLNYYFYNLQTTIGCVGTRVPVVATVTPAPSYTLTATPDTVCQGNSSTIAANSTNAYTYTWTPTGSGSSFQASPAATTTYVVSGIDANNCGMLDSVKLNVKSVPATVTTVASLPSVCVTGNVDLSLSPVPMFGIGIQWQKNTGSGYVDIPGANASTLTDAVGTTTSYQAKLSCNGTLVSTSTPVTVDYFNPTVLNTYPGSRCGPGPVTLGAMGTPAGTTINWYASASGGAPLATGNFFTTPSLSATTTYYAAPAQGYQSFVVGIVNGNLGNPFVTQTPGWGEVFTANLNCKIDSVGVFPVGTGTITVQILDPTTNNVLYTGPTTNITGTGTQKVMVPVGAVLTPGNYKMGMSSTGVTNFSNETISSSIAYPFVSTPITITAGSQGTGSTTVVYYFFYDWRVSMGCIATAVPVTATINGAASGTGLATGGTVAASNQADGTTVDYLDACNDKVATVTDAAGGNVLGNTSAIVLTSPTVQTLGTKPYVPRVFDISPASSGAATVTLYALQSEFTAYNSYVTANSLSLPLLPTGPTDVTGIGNIVVTQYHGAASAGTAGPGGVYSNANVDFIQNSSITASSNGTYWTITFPVTGFSGFFIHTGSVPLAIDLRNISAVNVGIRNRVDWLTGEEHIGDRFELERSATGSDFSRIATIGAKGQPSAYSYWDEKPINGVNYYRLKLVDAAGRSSYSRVVTATVKGGSFNVEVYPNPVQNVLTVKASGSIGEHASLEIIDVAGKTVRLIEMPSSIANIDMSILAPGIYFVKYTDSHNVETIKVHKQ